MTKTVLIPKAGKIDVPDPAAITPLDFIKQIIDNVSAQLQSIDGELQLASGGDNGQVFYLMETKFNRLYLYSFVIF